MDLCINNTTERRENLRHQDHDQEELPYFDETGNSYVHELNRQDAYIKRGGTLSAPQMIKYENRVAMLVERLVLIHEALQNDPDGLRDYLASIESFRQLNLLPLEVYNRDRKSVV